MRCGVTHAARSSALSAVDVKGDRHGRGAGCVRLITTSLYGARRGLGAKDKEIIFHFCVSVSVATLIIHNNSRRNISQSGSLRAWKKHKHEKLSALSQPARQPASHSDDDDDEDGE